jgi:uncharacterized ferritin-like protein (DUF455 family)
MDAAACDTSWPDSARLALQCRDVDAKLAAVQALVAALRAGRLRPQGAFASSDTEEPGRPERPELVAPRRLEQRSAAAGQRHAALIHAIAHIEFNAINLALDAACRFPAMPGAFYADWLRVAAEEARHFALLREHLRSLGRDYGDFPAHDGLWQMARKTARDPLVRMALVPRVLEARGLDASPGMIARLRTAGDREGAAILEVILRDEVGHVAIGNRWFEHLCRERGLDPDPTFETLLRAYDAPRPLLPLNAEARRRAGFSDDALRGLEALARGRTRAS